MNKDSKVVSGAIVEELNRRRELVLEYKIVDREFFDEKLLKFLKKNDVGSSVIRKVVRILEDVFDRIGNFGEFDILKGEESQKQINVMVDGTDGEEPSIQYRPYYETQINIKDKAGAELDRVIKEIVKETKVECKKYYKELYKGSDGYSFYLKGSSDVYDTEEPVIVSLEHYRKFISITVTV